MEAMNAPAIQPDTVVSLCFVIFQMHLHLKQCRSIAYGALGVMHADNISVAGVGRGLAKARGKSSKHCIKQIDRLLSNKKLSLDIAFEGWVPWVIAERERIVVAMDWTEHDHDDQSTIAIYLVTRHGRATPLVWKTVKKSTLKGKRNDYEDELLYLLYRVIPEDVGVTVLADRGFGDTALYGFLRYFGFDFVVRFRGVITARVSDGRKGKAKDFLLSSGRPIRYNDVQLTHGKDRVEGFVAVHESGMKDAWFLATSLEGSARKIVDLYGRRFTIEETFRDMKDLHFGLGLSSTHIGDPMRRDHLLLIAAVADVLLVLLGRAGEIVGLDRQLRANTVRERRTHSLFRQGREYLRGAVCGLVVKLRQVFLDLLKLHSLETETYAWI